ncbi:helix-turn-helix domain-containing protein [Nocardioides humi]|uniref:Transcriptional regulator MimR n=1 Tax=Nocardioides humi TaxID=449461 RepID=A0ABN2BWG4_9ACTN|nr:helix-turn-helix domain-containing protein [Nocardioides humi]
MATHSPDAADEERLDRIRLSHYRSQRAGLDSDTGLKVVTEDFDADSRLLNASRPALRRLSESLEGLMAGGLLTDRHGTVIDRYFGDDRMGRAADRLGAVIGASFNEERTGTNGLSVPLETREPILVHAEEHFLTDLRGFTCYGVPIVNPVTNRLEGVVDLMVEEAISPALMASVLDQAVNDITGRLLGDYDPGIAQQIAAFKSLSARTRDAVTLIARDFIVHNLRAADLVVGDDADALRQLAERLGPDDSDTMSLASGVDVTVSASSTGVDGAVLLRLRDGNRAKRRSSPSPRTTALERLIASTTQTTESVMVIGEPGSGRTRTALTIASTTGFTELDVSRTTPDERRATLAGLRQQQDAVLLVEHVDHLDNETARSIIDHMRAEPPLRVIATAEPGFATNPSVEYIASLCCSWIEIPPLRQRTAELSTIVERLLEDIATARSIDRSNRPAMPRATLHHLKSLPWPGNVAELRRVLEASTERRSVGDIVISDLPERYQRATSSRTNLTPIEQAERDLIIEALAQNSGNKVRAAQHLGISRSKLYDRLRHFRIELP